MYEIRVSNRFKKQVKLCEKRGYDLALLEQAIAILAEAGTLPAAYRAHKLSGSYSGYWECHIKGDWLLIWEQNDLELFLLFTGTGTHSDLF
ncbi:MAG: type II toxin-antitoxin system YafQ family toxin [Prevotellaceae bacterium]|nr:type II toxin-antitoxin system YafQ family toxin [Prevotellaceae bacterium]